MVPGSRKVGGMVRCAWKNLTGQAERYSGNRVVLQKCHAAVPGMSHRMTGVAKQEWKR